MNTTELKDKFADMWRKAREDANVSQLQAAKLMGVSKTTIQNWENGTACPNQEKGFEYFKKLNVQPLPYYLKVLYPEEFESVINGNTSDETVKATLHRLIDELPSSYLRKLLYLAYGNHGSSPLSVVELITANLHTPLRDRLNVAQHIILNYKIAEAHSMVVCPDNVKPNIDLLELATERGIEAVIRHENAYTATIE